MWNDLFIHASQQLYWLQEKLEFYAFYRVLFCCVVAVLLEVAYELKHVSNKIMLNWLHQWLISSIIVQSFSDSGAINSC